MFTQKLLPLQLVGLTLLVLLSACAQAGSSSAVVNGQAGVAGASDARSAEGSAQSNSSVAAAETQVIKSQTTQNTDKSSFQRAPALSSSTWINSQPLTLNDLQGQVVAVEFWTFACYNCKNTLPYVKHWYEKYHDRGLQVIGVHTPELSFEKDVENVRNAVRDYGIKYPVAIDGDFASWNRYNVWAWPTWFIIDKEGYVRYAHVGEGDYARSETTIQELLAE